MAVTLKKYDDKGFGTVEAADKVWAIEPNTDLVYMATVRQLNNARLGTVSTKTRSEVRGGGKKPWKQKGSGRARAGSSRSPLWKGGGVSFGPKPRSFKTSLPQKMAQKAVASVLSAKRDQVVVVADAQLQLSKTAEFATLLKKLEVQAGSNVLVVSGYQEELYRSTRNLDRVAVVDPRNVGVVDLLKADFVVLPEGALETLERRLA